MANDTFATFFQVSALGTGDFLVGYRDLNETRIAYSDVINTLASGVTGAAGSSYAVVNANSASWDSTYSTVNSLSDAWEESLFITPLQNASASWDSAYSTANSLSSSFIRSTLNYLSTTTIQFSSIQLVHFPANDGANPNLFIGETDEPSLALSGLSGFNIFYNELRNRLVVATTFGVSAISAVQIDPDGNIFAKQIPQTVFYGPENQFSTGTSTAYTVVSSLSFTAEANRSYEIYAWLPHRHSVAITNIYAYTLSYTNSATILNPSYLVEIQPSENAVFNVSYGSRPEQNHATGVTTASVSDRIAKISGTFRTTTSTSIVNIRAKNNGGFLYTLSGSYLSYRIIG